MGLFKDCGCGCNGKKQQDKLVISIISALTFFVDCQPRELSVSSGECSGPGSPPLPGAPTTLGLAMSLSGIHARRMGYDEHTKGIAMCEESKEGFQDCIRST